jgi:hypothetical protein
MNKHKHFYHHLVVIDSIHLGLDELELESHEKEDLLALVDKNIHHAILDFLLSELEVGDKKVFLALVFGGDHNEIWKMLAFKVHNAEEKIKKIANDLIKEFHKDIKEAHKKKKTKVI